jgi:hypothetical protein
VGGGGLMAAIHIEVVGAAEDDAWRGRTGRSLRGRRSQSGLPLHGANQ